MKRNKSWLNKRLSEGNLFDQTRHKLTLQYSGVLMIFLGLFVVIVYALLYVFIWSDQRSHLTELTNSELQVLQKWVDGDTNPKRQPPRSVEDAFSISADQSFYYLISDIGNVQLGDETQPELREQMMALIAKGQFKGARTQQTTLQTFDQPSVDVQGRPQNGEDARFLVTNRELKKNGQLIGTLYVGKEVTFQHQLFRLLLILMVGMALLFFVLALWFSHRMARRAIIPIAKAYERQREFVADASHELRTPLSVVLTSIEALQLDADESNPFTNNVLKSMKDEVNAITRLTSELLQLARSDADEFVLERSVFQVKAAAESVVTKLLPAAQAKGMVLQLHVPDQLNVEWDRGKLTQLLVILIDNAIKYTLDGGDVHIILVDKVEKGARFLTLDVRDNGMGIAPEALPRVFDRFYRQDKARTRQVGGHGLGLAIAKNLVDAAQGTIQVESQQGVGSTFRVRIPV
ncbi:sensor histidine kinase [Paenibacillus sp. Soil750]|uniref:sensor histidine kinase n=1 Tax=Paenibacillus sp. Soil750 TaxID=1736398 RepID=UPI0009EB5973|nr:HAMP domain-containing sensor histidine kinase [Paenibacillus sp. Soil750]